MATSDYQVFEASKMGLIIISSNTFSSFSVQGASRVYYLFILTTSLYG